MFNRRFESSRFPLRSNLELAYLQPVFAPGLRERLLDLFFQRVTRPVVLLVLHSFVRITAVDLALLVGRKLVVAVGAYLDEDFPEVVSGFRNATH